MQSKKIHYCWFGGSPLPKSVKECIKTWMLFFPDYEIKEWNESNFDINMMAYTKEAYKAKKYAYVSDVARFYVLLKEGGIYFDTDVEVIAPFDDILRNGAFIGVQDSSVEGYVPSINPGLGMGAEPGNHVIQTLFNNYKSMHSFDDNGHQVSGTIVDNTTEVLKSEFGLLPNNDVQKLNGIIVYPKDYFNPFDDATGVLNKTKNTRSIHWYSKTWVDRPMWYFKITRIIHRIFGVDALARFR